MAVFARHTASQQLRRRLHGWPPAVQAQAREEAVRLAARMTTEWAVWDVEVDKSVERVSEWISEQMRMGSLLGTTPRWEALIESGRGDNVLHDAFFDYWRRA